MGSVAITEKPHVVCIPFPAQGHINPMMKVAKLLHHRGFHITFVNTEYNHKRLLKSRGPESLKGLDTFRFETIPDGLPPSENEDETQDIPSLCEASKNNCLAPFKELLKKLNDGDSSDVPPVSCIVSDAIMSFTLDAAEELGIPDVLFWTTSACGFLGYAQYRRLIDEGFTPLKDASCLTNGYLDTVIDWIPGMEKNIRLRDLPSFVRTTDPNEFMLHFPTSVTERSKRASAIILNTYDALEHDVLAALSSIYPPIYSIGPVHLLVENQAMNDETKSIGSNLWKEDLTTLNWLDDKEPNSVVYVNFGSITVMTPQQLVEFAWGLANSKETFLWIIRSDLVKGDSAILKTEFITETKNRGLLASWCPQEKVLAHPSIGGFLTHNGWNSTIESISNGVPMVCWPFFAEQQTNVFYCCTKWEIGMEINSDVKRDEVEILVRELMQGEKGKKLRKKAMELKSFAEQAVSLDGSSVSNLDKFVGTLLRNLQKKYY